jgi:hypothetical protein
VGTILASDPDIGQTITYFVYPRNTNFTFSVNPSSGLITVINSSLLDMLITPVFIVLVEVEDDGIPVLTAVADITIELFASEPENGQTPSYKVHSGNAYSGYIDQQGITEGANFSVSIYPDPAVDNINIELNDLNTAESLVEITIMNLSGEKLDHQVFYTTAARFSENIDVGMLANGMYIIIVRHDRVSKSEKFIIYQ